MLVNLALSLFVALALPLAARGEWGAEPQCGFAVEMVFLQDFSDSFTDDREILAGQLLDLLNNIDSTYAESKQAFATFTDKPLHPFGHPYQGPWFEGDWCLNVTHDLDHEQTNAETVAELINSLQGGGNDWQENQLGAIHDVVKGDLARWSEAPITSSGKHVVRMLVVSTDSPYHIAGDGASSSWALRPNDGGNATVCDEEDYPSVEQVKAALIERDIYTVFLVGNSTNEDVFNVYTELLGALGTPGAVYNISSDSSDLLNTMEKVFENLEEDVCNLALDIVFSQDVTQSYTNDMVHFQPKMNEFMERMADSYRSARFGLTSFGDKPLAPFGHGPSGDYCYRLDQPLTANISNVELAASALRTTSGLDWRESQLDALISSALDTKIGWRSGSTWEGADLVRLVVIATDSGFHRFPHAAAAGYTLDGHNGLPTTPEWCTALEYPTWQQMAEAFIKADSHPVFLPTSDVASIYRRLNQKLFDDYDILGYVVELEDFQDWVNPTSVIVNKAVGQIRERRRRM